MKKRLILIIFASVLFFPGASPWEGSAAIAPNGELPKTGFYIATNAFPRNTVVDITNIETGKSTRVIVSSVLTSPGLLAVVSREAGELIGMRAGSLSRIRMIQPADPLAYMRFVERMGEPPEFDSGDVITEDNLLAEVYSDDTFAPPEAVSQVPETRPAQPSQTAQPRQPVQPPAQQTPPRQPRQPVLPGYIVDEPEWGGSGRLQIVDVPEFLTDPLESNNGGLAANAREPDPNNAVNTQRDITKDVAPKINERPPVEVAKDVPNYNPDRLLEDTETPRREVVKDVPVFITETPRNEVVKEVSPWQERVEVAAPSSRTPEQRILVPVETSQNPPPSSVYGINPNDIIPGIVVATPERPAPAANPAVNPQVNTTVSPAAVPPEVNNNSRTPTAERNAPANPPERNLPVNTIERLDRGKYYVQVAALSADLVENALRQIDRGFAPVVIKGADNIYRVLIGPLNQGESAAVLARVRSIGYKDAFVRVGG